MAILRTGQRSFAEVLDLKFDLVVGDLGALAARFKRHEEITLRELERSVARFHKKVKQTTARRCLKDTGFMSRNVETRDISQDGLQKETGWWRDTFETQAAHARYRFYAPYPELRQHSLSSSFYEYVDDYRLDVKDVLKRGEQRMSRGRP